MLSVAKYRYELLNWIGFLDVDQCIMKLWFLDENPILQHPEKGRKILPFRDEGFRSGDDLNGFVNSGFHIIGKRLICQLIV